MELTPEQLQTLQNLAKVVATGGLLGAGARATVGAINTLGPRYEPPPPPKPLVVDIPVPHAPPSPGATGPVRKVAWPTEAVAKPNPPGNPSVAKDLGFTGLFTGQPFRGPQVNTVSNLSNGDSSLYTGATGGVVDVGPTISRDRSVAPLPGYFPPVTPKPNSPGNPSAAKPTAGPMLPDAGARPAASFMPKAAFTPPNLDQFSQPPGKYVSAVGANPVGWAEFEKAQLERLRAGYPPEDLARPDIQQEIQSNLAAAVEAQRRQEAEDAAAVPTRKSWMSPGRALTIGLGGQALGAIGKLAASFMPKAAFTDTLNSLLGLAAPAAPKFQDPTSPGVLQYAAVPAAAIGGAGLGWGLTNKLIQAARRRGANKDLERARRDYQEAALGRISELEGGDKRAADWRAAAAGQTPADPDVRRAAAALDVIWGRAKAAENDPNYLARTVASMFAPGLVAGDTGAKINAGVIGASGLLGGLAGWRAFRDKRQATELQRQIQEMENDNASALPPPMIARMVPVGPDGRPIKAAPPI